MEGVTRDGRPPPSDATGTWVHYSATQAMEWMKSTSGQIQDGEQGSN